MNDHEFPSALTTSSQEFKPLFSLGQITATPAVFAHFNEHHQSILPLLRRHVSGDWGELCAEDKSENALSVRQGSRILSRYTVAGETVWIITEADRSVTTALFPSEY